MANIHVYESDENGFNTKNFFYDNGEEVVAFDTQFTPEIAQQSVNYLRTKTKNPITYLVITHPNPDKFNAINIFVDLGAKVIASQKTAQAMVGVHEYKKYYFVNIAKMFTEQTYPRLSQANETFEQDYELLLKNGDKVLLKELGQPGVSSNQTVAFIPNSQAVIVGDLVHHKAHAWLEGGIINGKPMPTLRGWIADLEELKRMFDGTTKVYGGRGQDVELTLAADEQINYLNQADKIVDQYIASLADKNELQGDKAQTHYNNLQKKFEEAFRDYKLPYMIGYSIYGLVNSKL